MEGLLWIGAGFLAGILVGLFVTWSEKIKGRK